MAAGKNPVQPKNLSEERLKSVLQLSSDWYWEQDKDLRFTLFSGKNLGEAGFESASLIGRTRWEIAGARFAPDERAAVQAKLDAREPFFDHEYERVGPDGLTRTISTSGVPVLDASGRFTGYRGIAKDITESKRAENLQKLEHSVARSIAESESVTAAVTAVIRAICEAEGWECGRYFCPNEAAEDLRLREAWGLQDAAIDRYIAGSRDITYTPGVGLVGRVWESGQPLWVPDLDKDARTSQRSLARESGMRGAFVFPIVSEGRTIGVLAFNSREVRDPEEPLLQAIFAIGVQIGHFLERKRAEEEQRLFRLALDNSADMILLIDRKTMRYVDVNQTVCNVLGYSREELLKMGPQDLVPESRAELAQAHDELIANPSSPSGMRSQFRCKDGSTIPFESIRHVLRSGDSHIIAAICRDIRERLAAEEAQRKQVALIARSAEKDRLLTLFYELPFVGLAVTAPGSKRWLQVNDYMCQMLGYPREELLQLAWTETTHPDDLPENLALFKRLTAGEFDSFQFDKRFVRKDGGIVDTTMEVRCVRRGDGSVETVVIMVRDITESKRAEQLQSLEHSVARHIAAAESVTAAMTAVIRAICETESWECGRYLRVDEEVGALRLDVSWGVPDPSIQQYIERSSRMSHGSVYRPGVGLIGQVWQSGQPLWVADVTKDNRVLQTAFAVDVGIRGGFVFPVKSEGKTIGVLAFNSRQVRNPDERLLKAILAIGAQIGQFLERKRAEEEERRFRAAMDASADLMLLIDPVSLRYVDVNDAACRALGYSREELLTMGPPDIFSTSREELSRLYERMIVGELIAPTVQGHYRRKDGSQLPIEAYPRAVRSGEGNVIVSVARDIQERLAAEKALRESEERYQETFELAAIGIAHVDAGGRFTSANRWLCELLGYTKEELLGLTVKQVSHPDDKNATDEVRAKLRDGRINSFQVEKRYLRKNGSVVWVGLTVAVKRGSSGDPLYDISVVEDISARKQAEDALRESEERFRSLTALSSDTFWEQDEQYRFTSVSGVDTGKITQTRVDLILGKKRWEQDFANMSADDWAKHIAILDARQPFRDLELSRADESGKTVWIAISGEPVFDSSGAFKGYRGVGKEISERKTDEEHIQFLANHDALTSLPNRAMFSDVLNLAIQNGHRYKRSFAVLFIDLDRFKIINDTMGHDAGDKLLKEMGVRLSETVRSSDVVARLGGDEFVVLVQEVSEAKQVDAVARKILSALVEPMAMQGQECRVTASIGICMFPADAQDEKALMKNADMAMYRAKEDGKNTYKFYSEETNVHTFERMALETSLRRGLERNEFFLHYQAKLDLHTKQITGVEALVRWQHPDLGVVPPMQFIPLAEETGLILPIGKWVLNTACAQNVAWQREGLPPLCIAVNLSARQFADEDLVKDIADALKESGMKAELLELELTESMVMQNADRAGKVLAEIKKLGVRLAIDDFGVGYSSLTHLKRFPIDTLKVDRSFIRDLPQNPEDRAICEAIIAMGKSLNLTVIAEGVETLEQQTFLHDHACDETQGFFFSKPISSDQFAELLRQRIQSSKQ
jgi:diguanylate cyclase (GGDEF)-like protein/PAS domain S-box-containing protein